MRPKKKHLLSKQSHWGIRGWWLKPQAALTVGSAPLTALAAYVGFFPDETSLSFCKVM